jgi:hypothetical protein
VALGNSPKLQTFCHLIWPGRQLWNRDLDALADTAFVSQLAELTGCDFERAWQTSLRSLSGTVFEEVQVTGPTRWILPLGIYHRTRRRAGQQWCPACLQEDAHPYYRRSWRLAFSTTCSIHESLLADRCHACAQPATPHRTEDPRCHECGTDRRDHPSRSADPAALDLERRMRSLAENTSMHCIDLDCPHPLAFFSLIRQVLAIVTANPRAARLRSAICASHGGDPQAPVFASKPLTLESLPVGERHRMMAIAARLLSNWPDNFVALCTEAKMWPSWAMRGQKAHIPLAYSKVVGTLSSGSRTKAEPSSK